MLSWLCALILVLVLIGLFGLILSKKSGGPDSQGWPFESSKPLNTTEQGVYRRLREAMPDRVILCQVALSALVKVRKGHPSATWFNRISRKSLDFVVCNEVFDVIAVIEIDGPSHRKVSQRNRDEVKDRALSAAGIRIVRWSTDVLPDVAAIRTLFDPGPAVESDSPIAAAPQRKTH